jgi:hypothetical protein
VAAQWFALGCPPPSDGFGGQVHLNFITFFGALYTFVSHVAEPRRVWRPWISEYALLPDLSRVCHHLHLLFWRVPCYDASAPRLSAAHVNAWHWLLGRHSRRCASRILPDRSNAGLDGILDRCPRLQTPVNRTDLGLVHALTTMSLTNEEHAMCLDTRLRLCTYLRQGFHIRGANVAARPTVCEARRSETKLV